MKTLQRGFTLVEVLGALAIGSILMVGLSQMINTTLDDAKGQQASLYQAQFTAAASKYINANYQWFVDHTIVGGAPVPVTLVDLQAGKLLPSSLAVTNPYQQNTCVLVRQPTAGKLDALVATYGGQPIPEKDLPAVALNAGQGGGYISADSLKLWKVQGASWLPTATTSFQSVSCSGGATVLVGGAADGGHLVSNLFYDGPSNLPTDFLYRNDIGNPQLNTMNTSVRIAGGGLVTEGSDCKIGGVVVPGIAIDAATKQLVVCNDSGLWSNSSQWKEAIDTYGNLPSAGSSEGDVRMVLDKGRAFTYHGGTWVALAVDQNDNLNVPKNIVANGNITSSGYMYSMSNITALGYIYAIGDLCTDSDLDVTSGNATVNGNMTVTGSITGKGALASPGASCAGLPRGTIARDGNGLPLVCYSDNTFRYADGTYTP